MQLPFIIANWKMNKTIQESTNYARGLERYLVETQPKATVIVCPCAIFLPFMSQIQHEHFSLGVQNFFPADKGSFTGECSLTMFDSVDISYAIVGHSERRQLFKESDELLQQKVIYALEKDYTVIFCIGETKEEKEQGLTEEVILKQLEILSTLPKEKKGTILIAYEPLWAIGTGIVPSRESIQSIVQIIQKYAREMLAPCNKNIYTLYGGSVTQDNIDDILNINGIQGVLIGSASLELDTFITIIQSV